RVVADGLAGAIRPEQPERLAGELVVELRELARLAPRELAVRPTDERERRGPRDDDALAIRPLAVERRGARGAARGEPAGDGSRPRVVEVRAWRRPRRTPRRRRERLQAGREAGRVSWGCAYQRAPCVCDAAHGVGGGSSVARAGSLRDR